MREMEEMVIWVDEDNRELGVVPRSRMRRERLAHRATFVYVFRRRGAMLVQKRTMTKDLWPGYWDLAAGGVVSAGESYRDAAERELAEEMGIAGAELREHFDFWMDHADARAWGRVYTCVWEGEIRPQPEEVEYVVEARVEDVLEGRWEGPVTPDSLAGLQRLAAERLIP